MKIVYLFILLSLFSGVYWVGVPTQNQPWQFNYEFNEALKYEWRIKIQEKSGMSLFDEARLEVQNTLKIKEWTKLTEWIHNVGIIFCQWLFGTCDHTSIYARLIAGCELARDTALAKMESNFVRNNTELLLASYTTCYDLAGDVLMSFKDAASIGVAEWNKEQIVSSQEKFIEKTQETFQDKVSNTWDTFKKKLTNFVRWIEWFAEEVFV